MSTSEAKGWMGGEGNRTRNFESIVLQIPSKFFFFLQIWCILYQAIALGLKCQETSEGCH